MDFDAESSSTEAAVAFATVSEVAAAVDVPRDVGDKSSARDVEPEKGDERHNTASLKSNVSPIIRVISLYFSLIQLIKFSPSLCVTYRGFG